MLVYFEKNGICRARDAGVSGAELRTTMLARGMQPVVGVHTTYEIARAIQQGSSGAGPAAAAGAIVCDLEPAYAQPVPRLLARELEKARSGVSVVALLEGAELAAARRAAIGLAAGQLSDTESAFIRRRELDISKNYPRMAAEYIEANESLERSGADVPRLPTFAGAIAHFEHQFSDVIQQLVRATPREAAQIAEALAQYPALGSAVRANVYLSHVCIRDKRAAATDKLDDLRYAIEAAYCDALVTHDKQLQTNAPLVTPGLRILTWDDVAP